MCRLFRLLKKDIKRPGYIARLFTRFDDWMRNDF